MLLRVVLAWIHLLGLGIGLGAVWGRASAARHLSRAPADADLRSRVLGGRSLPSAGTAKRIATISYIETALVALIALAAVSMARGLGAR